MRVLAVDDEKLALQVLVRELHKIPEIAVVDAFDNSLDALEFVRGQEIDLAVLDISMSGMNGLTLAKNIKELRPKATILFVTAFSEYAVDAFQLHAAGYLMKPVTAQAIQAEINYWKAPTVIPQKTRRVRIQTFGNFDIFVDGKLLSFTREQPKELLAYLVDRRGASVTTAEISAVLWEDKLYDRSMKNRVQTVVTRLMQFLKDAGVEQIVVKGWNHLALDVAQVDCDYYRLLEGDTDALNAYRGECMKNYSWAEFTAGGILREQRNQI